MQITEESLQNGDWITTAQAARILGCTPQYIIRLAKTGRLDHVWTPHGRLFPAGKVQRMARDRSRKMLSIGS